MWNNGGSFFFLNRNNGGSWNDEIINFTSIHIHWCDLVAGIIISFFAVFIDYSKTIINIQ